MAVCENLHHHKNWSAGDVKDYQHTRLLINYHIAILSSIKSVDDKVIFQT